MKIFIILFILMVFLLVFSHQKKLVLPIFTKNGPVLRQNNPDVIITNMIECTGCNLPNEKGEKLWPNGWPQCQGKQKKERGGDCHDKIIGNRGSSFSKANRFNLLEKKFDYIIQRNTFKTWQVPVFCLP